MALPDAQPIAARSGQRRARSTTEGARATRLLRVLPWDDALADGHCVDPRSRYVERFWLPVLGPSSTWLLRRLVDELETSPEGADVDVRTLASSLGIGGPESRHAPLERALRRCARFGAIADVGAGTVAVRRLVPMLPRHLLARLPATLRIEHRRWELDAPEPSGRARRRAYQAAVDLWEPGGERTALERRLHRLGVHPALAYGAAGWVEAAAEPVAEPPA